MLAYLVILLVAAGCGIFLRRVVVYATTVRSNSMLPTLVEGDLLLTRRIRAGTRLRRGDIVVLYLDELQQRVVKRLVGLPGDEISAEPDRMVHAPGNSTQELSPIHESGSHRSERIPTGHYFFLGDNRPYSIDSRAWIEPCVARSKLEGKVCLRLWPRPRRFVRGR